MTFDENTIGLFSDEYFMGIALGEANEALRRDEIPIGAVIVSEGRIIARSGNQTETLRDVTAHAEILAITSASDYLGGKYLRNCAMYVTLEPCLMCAGALFWSKIDRLVFGANDPKQGFTHLAPKALHSKTQILGGILQDECASIIQNFFGRLRT